MIRLFATSGAALLGLTLLCHAEQKLELNPADQKKMGDAVMQLAFAEGCDRRLDMPDVFLSAKENFRRVAEEVHIPDAAALTERVASELTSKPSEPETAGFTLFNPKLCGDLARHLTKQAD